MILMPPKSRGLSNLNEVDAMEDLTCRLIFNQTSPTSFAKDFSISLKDSPSELRIPRRKAIILKRDQERNRL